jgi:hypothetical protein
MSISPLLFYHESQRSFSCFMCPWGLSLGTVSRLLKLFVFAGVRGLCTYRIEKRILQ